MIGSLTFNSKQKFARYLSPVPGSRSRSTGDGGGDCVGEPPLCREVETWPDGRPFLTRSGRPWTWHTCKRCADSGKIPFHHPDQCDAKDPDWRAKAAAKK